MHAIDTNVLVRLLAQDDAKQAAAAQKFVQHGAWVSLLVLMEACWVLDTVFEVSADSLVAALDMLLEHESIALQEPDVVRAALAHLREHPKLGFSDCLILEVARKAGHVPLGTFDRSLSKLPDTQRLLT